MPSNWASYPSPLDPRLRAGDSAAAQQRLTGAAYPTAAPTTAGSVPNSSKQGGAAHSYKVYGNSSLAAMAANMRLATSTFAGPIIPDGPRAAAATAVGEAVVGGGRTLDPSMAPFPCDHYSDAELATVSLLQLYHRSCALLGVRPNGLVERHLPPTTAPIAQKPHLKIHVIDLSRTYLGPAGCAALVPVVAACRRLAHLRLDGCGLSHSVALSLIEILRVHPSLREVDLRNNDLGTTVGQQLLRLVLTENRRIYSLGGGPTASTTTTSAGASTSATSCTFKEGASATASSTSPAAAARAAEARLSALLKNDGGETTEDGGGPSPSLANTLIIPALKKKIDAALAKNYYFRMEYAPDPIALLASEQMADRCLRKGGGGGGEEESAEADAFAVAMAEDEALRRAVEGARAAEAARAETARRLKAQAAQQLPLWFPVAAAELCAVLNRQRHSMNDVLAVFSAPLPAPKYSSSSSDLPSSAAADRGGGEPNRTVTLLALGGATAAEGSAASSPAKEQDGSAATTNEVNDGVDVSASRTAIHAAPQSVGDSATKSALATEARVAVHLDALCERIPLRQFQRAMRIFNVTSLAGCVDRCALFLECFGALYVDVSLEEAVAVARGAMARDSAARVIAEGLSGLVERHAGLTSSSSPPCADNADVTAAEAPAAAAAAAAAESVIQTSSPDNGIVTAVAGTPSGDALIARLPIAEQITANALPMNHYYHTRAAAADNAQTAGSAATNGTQQSFTRYLAEDQKDLLLANVPKVIHCLRVHARYTSTSNSVAPSSAENDGVDGATVDATTAEIAARPSPAAEASVAPSSATSAAAVLLRQRALALQQWLFGITTDRVYDARREIYECAALLDADSTGHIYFHELCAGVGSVALVHLFAHRREISRYMKLIRAIEAEEDRSSAAAAAPASDVSTGETPVGGAVGDENLEGAAASTHPRNSAAASVSYPHDSERDMAALGAFVERYLKVILTQSTPPPPDADEASNTETTDGTSSANVKESLLIDPISRLPVALSTSEASLRAGAPIIAGAAEDVSAFALVPYRRLIGSDRPVITVTETDAKAHREHRCDPMFWAHATKRSLGLLMNPPL